MEQFKIDCSILGIKPILIETQNNNDFEQQIMTSSKYSDDDYGPTLNLLCENLSLKYKILRKKVEIKPENTKNKNFIYYESHLRLKLPKNYNYIVLNELCKNIIFIYLKIYSKPTKNTYIR
jgi:hypothetical protein